jgi:Spermidine/putrescine-binding periplasmic protein
VGQHRHRLQHRQGQGGTGDNAPLDSWDLIFKPEYMSKLKSCGVAVLDNGPELLPIALHYLGLPHHSQNPATTTRPRRC